MVLIYPSLQGKVVNFTNIFCTKAEQLRTDNFHPVNGYDDTQLCDTFGACNIKYAKKRPPMVIELIQTIRNTLEQEGATYGPRATSGPRRQTFLALTYPF